jgi:hypothetical protein
MSNPDSNFRFAPPDTRAALVIAHPGHELKVFGWLEVAQPRVFVLTDGSGRSGRSRLSSTTRILKQAGARPGSIYGRLTDSAGYAAILNQEFDLFIELAKELTEAFVNEQINFVAGDALEGYNPMHDVCRLVTNAAVTLARQARGHDIPNFEFSLISPPDVRLEPPPANEIWFRLDETALARKISIAQGYTELAGEVMETLGRTSVEAFSVERLHLSDPAEDARRFDAEPPFYEHYGEKQVAAGHYTRLLRYNEHLAPLAGALRRHTEAALQ